MKISNNNLRLYVRFLVREWHEYLDMVMLSNSYDDDDDDEQDNEDRDSDEIINKRDPKDPYGGSFESRGKKPKPLSTSNAFVHSQALKNQKAGVGMGSGPQSGRFPGGKSVGFGM